MILTFVKIYSWQKPSF